MILKSNIQNPISNIQSGYTLIEMAVVLFLLVLLSTILFANYYDINNQGDLLRAAERVKNALRTAHLNSTQGKAEIAATTGWGVYLDRWSNSYTLFADLNGNRQYYDSANSPDSKPLKLMIHGTEEPNGDSLSDSSGSFYNGISWENRTVHLSGAPNLESGPGKPANSGNGYWRFGVGNYFYLSPADQDNAAAFDFSSNDFVIDFWFNVWQFNLQDENPLLKRDGDVLPCHSYYCYIIAGGNLICDLCDTNQNHYNLNGGIIEQDRWYHVALLRDGKTFKLFLDGVEQGRSVLPTGITALYNAPNSELRIADSNTDSNSLFGYTDEIRIAKGFHHWDRNFNVGVLKPHSNDPEKIKTIQLLPGIVFKQLLQDSVAKNQLNIFFDPSDFKTYLNNSVSNQSAKITLGLLTNANLQRMLTVQPNGLTWVEP